MNLVVKNVSAMTIIRTEGVQGVLLTVNIKLLCCSQITSFQNRSTLMSCECEHVNTITVTASPHHFGRKTPLDCIVPSLSHTVQGHVVTCCPHGTRRPVPGIKMKHKKFPLKINQSHIGLLLKYHFIFYIHVRIILY